MGNFSIANEEGGWSSHGALIAARTAQFFLCSGMRKYKCMVPRKVAGQEEKLTTVVQP